MRLKLILITAGLALIFALWASGAFAQYYWDGYRWVWQGYGPPTREYPPGPAYPPRPNCQGQPCVDEFHRFGGRDQRPCFDQWGNLGRC
jgi:hypothetical protein